MDGDFGTEGRIRSSPSETVSLPSVRKFTQLLRGRELRLLFLIGFRPNTPFCHRSWFWKDSVKQLPFGDNWYGLRARLFYKISVLLESTKLSDRRDSSICWFSVVTVRVTVCLGAAGKCARAYPPLTGMAFDRSSVLGQLRPAVMSCK